MDKIASELLVGRLADWGVDTVFGLPGDGINVLAITGMQETAVLGTGHQQEVHLDRLFMLPLHRPSARARPGPHRPDRQRPIRAGNRMPTDVPLVGDAAATLRALLPLLERKADRGFLEQAQEAMATWRQDLEALESPARYRLPITVVVNKLRS